MDNNNRDSLGTRSVVKDGPHAKTNASGLSNQRRKIIKASAASIPAIMTLRSGAAAAMTSASQCLARTDTPINTTSDLGGVDPILGDAETDDLSLDRLLRVAAKPGMMTTYVARSNHKQKTYYFIRKDEPYWPWTDLEGWLIYNKNGELLSERKRKKRLGDNKFMDAWENKSTAFYGVDSHDGLIFVEESAIPVALALPLPGAVITDMMNSTTMVFLVAYYDEFTGEITHWPMPKGEALVINGSCLASIDPLKFQR